MKTVLFFLNFLLVSMSIFAQGTNYTVLSQKRDSREKVLDLINASETSWQTGDYTNGMLCAKEAKIIARKLKLQKEEATALNNIGIIHEYQGRFADALTNYFDALKIQKLIKDEDGIAYTYNNIGLVYSFQRNYIKAHENYKKSLEIRKRLNDQHGLSSTYNNLGILFMYQKDYEKALENYNQSIKIDSNLNNVSGMSDSYSNVGLVYMEMADFKKAEQYFFRALEIREKIKDKRGVANSYNNIATLLINQEKYQAAEEYLQKGLLLSEEMGAKDLIEYSYQQLAQIAEKENRFTDAFRYQKMYFLYRDSIQNEIETKKQTEAEMQFKFDQERQKELLKKQKEDLINKEAKQRLTFLIIGLCFIVFITLSFAFTLNKRRKKELAQKIIIEEQKKIVEQKNQEILDSITYAKRIQTAILPTDRIVKEFLTESFILYKPKDIVAGDFYWIEPYNGRVLFAVADCTGHGVPGALVSVICHNALNRSVREFNLTDPGNILNKCRDLILEEFRKSDDNVQDRMDISICQLEIDTRKLTWSGANLPLWIKKPLENDIHEYKPQKQPIGYFDEIKPFESIEMTLSIGDTIYLFSDGFSDQFGGSQGKKLKSKGMKDLLLSLSHLPMAEQRQQIDLFFENWRAEHEQIDDICIIGIRL